jgi:hypothetical protein
MRSAQWGSLTKSVRIAAVALAVHAFLLAVEWLFFAATYSASNHGRTWWSVLWIVVFCLFVWSILTEKSSRSLLGVGLVFVLLTDLIDVGDILMAPALTSGQALLTVGLLLSLTVGIGALLWPAGRRLFRTPAA